MEEDSGSILCQISSYKDMLDQVNEEIEAHIQRTRYIESEIVRCSEIEKSYLTRESELMKMVFAGEFELNSLTEVGVIPPPTESVIEVDADVVEENVTVEIATMRRSLDLMEKEVTLVRLDLENMVEGICKKREQFIMECKKFQEEIVTGENKELHEFLCEEAALESEKQKLISKINALKNSTTEFIEDVLGDLLSSVSALEVEIQHTSLENEKVLKDIHELKALLLKLV